VRHTRLYDWMGEMADEVLLAHPLKVRAIADVRIKTDKIDSEMLVHLLRVDLVLEAHAPLRKARATKRVPHVTASMGPRPDRREWKDNEGFCRRRETVAKRNLDKLFHGREVVPCFGESLHAARGAC
jgi:hypothetical protein